MTGRSSDQPKYAKLMLVTAILAVTAVGVSTAKVVHALSHSHADSASLLFSDSDSEAATDLNVTLQAIPKSDKRRLVLENTNDEELNIHHMSQGLPALGAEFCADHSEFITLQPKQKISVFIDGPSAQRYSDSARLVSMKGRVIDGHLLITGS